MKKFGFLLCAMLLGTTVMYGQGARNIKINEVLTSNTASLQDECGNKRAWVELANVSFSTYNVRGMYITTNRKVLENITVPERIALMSCIPNDEAMSLSARQHLVLFLNSNPTSGVRHLNVEAKPGEALWIALYDGNGVDLIDSVTVPKLADNQSYARVKDGGEKWSVKSPDFVTPGIENYIHVDETKTARLKREDPYGFGITILAMGIVFFCLALLFVFFTLFGIFMKHRSTVAKIQPVKAGVKTVEKTVEIGHKTNVILQDGLKSKGIDKEVYIAVIAMALKEYQDNVHDVESGIITIKPKNTEWNQELPQMTQFHE